MLGKQETLTLEFKSDHPNEPMFVNGELSTNGRKILAKELSAFANSAGGLIVYGIDCRKVNGVDEAVDLRPVVHLSKAETSIRNAASELLQPRHSDIEVMSIPSASDANAGFIVVNVPRSERRPHRSEAKGQKEYFKRSGASAFAMEHYDIEDAFKRQSSPLLSLNFDFRWGMKSGQKFGMQLLLGVTNRGEVSGKSVTLQIWNQPELILQPIKRLTSVSQFDGRMTFAAASDFVVHPDQTRIFEQLDFELIRVPEGLMISGRPLLPGRIAFDYSIGALDMRSQQARFVLDETHIRSILKSTER
ncbi:hypothetical protein LCM4579_15305 [Ensifer sp. LCM 4579]|nr:hypothetical protein LCM4579_15305 [Ensifer sp. LCM 4579]